MTARHIGLSCLVKRCLLSECYDKFATTEELIVCHPLGFQSLLVSYAERDVSLTNLSSVMVKDIPPRVTFGGNGCNTDGVVRFVGYNAKETRDERPDDGIEV